MALKIRRQNTSILDTFNDEDIQKEYDKMKLAIIADDIFDAYEIYQKKKDYEKDIYFYKPKSLEELKYWIKKQNRQKVEKLDVSWIDVSDMTSLRNCFSNTEDQVGYFFTEINGLNKWDVKNVENMSCIFEGCLSLTEIKGIENWDVSNVKYMSSMFASCRYLKTLDLSNWADKVSKVTDMVAMFENCETLTEIKGIENWDVSNVKYMSFMFDACKLLKTLDLSNWADTVRNVTDMCGMFYGCEELTEIKGI